MWWNLYDRIWCNHFLLQMSVSAGFSVNPVSVCCLTWQPIVQHVLLLSQLIAALCEYQTERPDGTSKDGLHYSGCDQRDEMGFLPTHSRSDHHDIFMDNACFSWCSRLWGFLLMFSKLCSFSESVWKLWKPKIVFTGPIVCLSANFRSRIVVDTHHCSLHFNIYTLNMQFWLSAWDTKNFFPALWKTLPETLSRSICKQV